MNQIALWIELLVLYGAIPAALAIWPGRVPVVLLLSGLGLLCFLRLWYDRSFDRKLLWNVAGFKRSAKGIAIRFAIVAPLLTLLVYLLAPKVLFGFPKESPWMWLLVMLLYPLLSAFPQELLCRTWFFHRYLALFPGERTAWIVNAICFGWMHVVLRNSPAVVLSAIAGLIMVRTYRHSNSTLAVAVEHGLLGDLVFTLGLGVYFYSGFARG